LKRSSLTTSSALCGVLSPLAFIGGIALVISSGVDGLIPDTGQNAIDWIGDVNAASDAFLGGAWLVIAGGLLGLVALVGFWRPLRDAGEALILAPILAVAGMTLVTISHLLGIAIAYELVPGYVDGSRTTRDSLAVTTDTLVETARLLNYVGGVLVFGVVVALYAWAVLKTKVLPRWIGWVGVVTAVFAGWLGTAAPASRQLEDATFIGLAAFFVWLAAMGIAILRRRPPRPAR
jgi:Domain of unknown function (DUF4386)